MVEVDGNQVLQELETSPSGEHVYIEKPREQQIPVEIDGREHVPEYKR